jgi:hypothetical protein
MSYEFYDHWMVLFPFCCLLLVCNQECTNVLWVEILSEMFESLAGSFGSVGSSYLAIQ